MILPSSSADLSNLIVAGYVRRSSEMQKDNYSIDAQRRGIREGAKARGLPEPIFYEDDERSARGEQIAKRPDFKRLLDDVQAGKVHVIIVHTESVKRFVEIAFSHLGTAPQIPPQSD